MRVNANYSNTNNTTYSKTNTGIGVYIFDTKEVDTPGVYLAKITGVEKTSETPIKIEVTYELLDINRDKTTFKEAFVCSPRNSRWIDFCGYVKTSFNIPIGSDVSALVGMNEVIELIRNGRFLTIAQREVVDDSFKCTELPSYAFEAESSEAAGL